jgi:hypothetical protein
VLTFGDFEDELNFACILLGNKVDDARHIEVNDEEIQAWMKRKRPEGSKVLRCLHAKFV